MVKGKMIHIVVRIDHSCSIIFFRYNCTVKSEVHFPFYIRDTFLFQANSGHQECQLPFCLGYPAFKAERGW